MAIAIPVSRAKFRCCEKNQSEVGFALKFRPVTGGSPENENFYKYTPGGELSLSTVNEKAAEGFEVGKSYYLDFTPADE